MYCNGFDITYNFKTLVVIYQQLNALKPQVSHNIIIHIL